MTPDGNYVAFYSLASNLVVGDTNGSWDVFVRNMLTGTTSRVSVASNSQQGNGHSYQPSISADGRFIAFYSEASNLVTVDTNGKYDIFVHDMLTRATIRVSVDSNGEQLDASSQNPSISADGRYVVFESDAADPDPEDNSSLIEIFLHDIQTGQTSMISVASDGTQANGSSSDAKISSNGRYVVFESYANNLSSLDTNFDTDIFLRDRQLGTTTLVSVNSSGIKGNANSEGGRVTPDGQYVVFSSYATNLVTGDTNDFPDVFVHNMQTGSTVRASVSSTGQEGNQPSWASAITPDGQYVLFASASSNFITGDTNTYTDGFIT